ncbi:MAG: phosphotransferase [Defluviitaleaceae bacterium]|nr:phosphotransferase [Defluviitaleaceae bacterium]
MTEHYAFVEENYFRIKSCELVRKNIGISYKVIDFSDNKYILKINPSIHESLTGLQYCVEGISSEIKIIKSIPNNKWFNVPTPIKNKDGNFISYCHDSCGNLCSAYLLKWIDGVTLENCNGEMDKTIKQFGVSLSRLHNMMSEVSANKDLQRPIYNIEKFEIIISKLQKAIIDNIITESNFQIFLNTFRHAKEIIRTLHKDRSTYGLIHADLQGSNIIIGEECKIGFIDFTASGYGFYLHDVADAIATMNTESRPAFLYAYNDNCEYDAHSLHVISTFAILTYLNAYSMHLNNKNMSRWISANSDYLAIQICPRYLRGESICYDIHI